MSAGKLNEKVPDQLKDSTDKLLSLMAQCTVFHNLDSDYWESIEVAATNELNQLTQAAINENYLGGLASTAFQITAITLSNRIELVRAFNAAVATKLLNPTGE